MARTLTLSACLMALADPSRGAEIHGNARVYGGPTESGDVDSDQLDQRYTLNLTQALTPFFNLGFTYRRTEFRNDATGGTDFERSSDDPRLELVYRRPRLTGRLSFRERRNRGTIDSDNLDVESFIGQLRWRPLKGPSYALQFRDETNVADTGIFGRDIASSLLGFETIYNRQIWSTRYTYQTTRLDNRTTGFRLDEDRHQLRASYDRRLWRDTLAFSAHSWISRREQHEVTGSGSPATPISARRGLFAIDTTPGVGELDEATDLIDGDVETPAAPGIAIGGAHTFRNLGVDLGLTRQVTRLEATVDATSDPGLIWQVYHSSDNLSWAPVSGVESVYDGAQSRYTLRFPATTDRYFKAVNVSINTFNGVSVTELRALVDVERLASREGRSTTYRADLAASYTPHDKVQAGITFGVGNDEDLAGGLLSRDLDDLNYGAQLRVALTGQLDLRVGYRFTSVEEQLEERLQRDEAQWTAAFEWAPLPTVNGRLSFSRRDEKDGNVLIRSADTLRLSAFTQLLKRLGLTSEVTWSDIDDPFSGFEQRVWRWHESLDAALTERLGVRGSISQSFYDSTGTVAIDRRTSVDLLTTWKATPYLSLSGDWSLNKDDTQRTLSQRYSASYTPGRKLSASFSYQNADSTDVRQTTTLGGSVNYRLRPRLAPFVNFSRSSFRETGAEPTENTSLRGGINFSF